MKKTFLMLSLFVLLFGSSALASPVGEWEFAVDDSVLTLIGWMDVSLSFDGSILSDGSYDFGAIAGYIDPLGSADGKFGPVSGTGTLPGVVYDYEIAGLLNTHTDASGNIITLENLRLDEKDSQTLQGFLDITVDLSAYAPVTYDVEITGSRVPIPGAIWLLGSGLIGIIGIRRKYRKG